VVDGLSKGADIGAGGVCRAEHVDQKRHPLNLGHAAEHLVDDELGVLANAEHQRPEHHALDAAERVVGDENERAGLGNTVKLVGIKLELAVQRRKHALAKLSGVVARSGIDNAVIDRVEQGKTE
jgi:hypothetical protein